MKTVGIIASCDTKYHEVQFMRRRLEELGLQVCVVDMAVGLGESKGADITREEVFANLGYVWSDLKSKTKGELVALMMDAMRCTIVKLYKEGKIDGLLSAGGVQNTSVAVASMQVLPMGFPKVIATTVASGQKPFGDVVGTKDIVTIPSISDFTGINCMTAMTLGNACACVAGLVLHGAGGPKKPKRKLVGLTLMGITNDGCCAAVEELDRLGIEAIGFHSTGVGGTVMEQMALDGTLDGILDMTTHEITSEFFGGGFSYGAQNRLLKPLAAGIPMVVSVGGLDFVDFAKENFPPRMDERVYNMHNAKLAHIKILPDEALEVGRIFAERLNTARRPVILVLPTKGMRKNTRPGGNLYNKETDDALLHSIRSHLKNELVQIVELEGNLNDRDWGVRIARIMAEYIAK